MIKIDPYEIALLERFIEISYFERLRDTWEELVGHIEACLHRYTQELSLTHRSKPLPEQADIVWGGRIIPNFRNTLEGLRTGFILLSHGDAEGYAYAHSVRGDFKGQMEYDTAWMGRENENKYGVLMHIAVSIAHNICLTEGAYWSSLYLCTPDQLGLPNEKITPGNYKINKNVSVHTGEKTLTNGIYIADVADSCPQFLSKRYKEAPKCNVLIGFNDLFDSITNERYAVEPQHVQQQCIWYLVEREADRAMDLDAANIEGRYIFRARSGDACPRSGYYFTPAQSNSRRKFQRGEIMPVFDSSYGSTIWQWDGEAAP